MRQPLDGVEQPAAGHEQPVAYARHLPLDERLAGRRRLERHRERGRERGVALHARRHALAALAVAGLHDHRISDAGRSWPGLFDSPHELVLRSRQSGLPHE